MRTVCMSSSVTENVRCIAVSPLDKVNSMVKYEVLIRSASVPPFDICDLFVYKQLRWTWSKLIKGVKEYQFAKFEAHSYYLSTIINDLSIFSI